MSKATSYKKYALKPCPFCGSTPFLRDKVGAMRHSTWSIRCSHCNLEFGYDDYSGGMFKTQEAAIQAWNRRAPNA